MKIICVVGARPNFVKIAPILEAFKAYDDIEAILVHTGQHYDKMMSDSFFQTLGIRAPDISLGVGSATHAQQTAAIMKTFEPMGSLDRTVAASWMRNLTASSGGVPANKLPISPVLNSFPTMRLL